MGKEWLENRLQEYSFRLNDSNVLESLIDVSEMVRDVRRNGKKIMFAGNGASNTISSHAALDYMNQLGVRCISLNDPNIMSAFSNDFGYENWMSRFVKLQAEEGDMIILTSSSGESENVIRAAKVANKMRCSIVTFTGFEKDNTLKEFGDVNLWVDSMDYNIVENVHMIWSITVCDFIVSLESNRVGKHGVIL